MKMTALATLARNVAEMRSSLPTLHAKKTASKWLDDMNWSSNRVRLEHLDTLFYKLAVQVIARFARSIKLICSCQKFWKFEHMHIYHVGDNCDKSHQKKDRIDRRRRGYSTRTATNVLLSGECSWTNPPWRCRRCQRRYVYVQLKQSSITLSIIPLDSKLVLDSFR